MRVIRGGGGLLVTLGAVVLLFVAYLMWGTALRASTAQHQLSRELNQQRASVGTSGHMAARPASRNSSR